MQNSTPKNRLDYFMSTMHIPASAIAEATGINHSLITKWRRGERKLHMRSKGIHDLAGYIASKDFDGTVRETLARHGFTDETGTLEHNLALYLCGSAQVRTQRASEESLMSGEFTITHRVYLGESGLRSAMLNILDYMNTLPPNQEIIAVCDDNYDWIVGDKAFVMILIMRLRQAFVRGVTITVINRKRFDLDKIVLFSGPWLVAHMRGYIRSLYYEDKRGPSGVKVLASTKGYWGLTMREDEEVEDHRYVVTCTDRFSVQEVNRACETYRDRAYALFQYSFLTMPSEMDEGMASERLTDSALYMIQRTPSFGIMTCEEFLGAGASAQALERLRFLFLTPEQLPGDKPIRLILCKEDVADLLKKEHKPNAALICSVGNRASFIREEIIAQLERIHGWMEDYPNFEVALIPRIAFDRIGMEMHSFENGPTVAWLSDASQSTCTKDPLLSGALFGFAGEVWDHLLKGWKARNSVMQQLGRLLRGKGLNRERTDTRAIRSWDVLPR